MCIRTRREEDEDEDEGREGKTERQGREDREVGREGYLSLPLYPGYQQELIELDSRLTCVVSPG